MEEFNLFNELNNLKNEIEKDLSKILRLECDLKLRSSSDNNKELNDRIKLLNAHYNNKIEEIQHENVTLSDRLNQVDNILKQKSKVIETLEQKLQHATEDNAKFELSLQKLKNENLRMEKIIKGKDEEQELERKTREYLRQLYEVELHNIKK